MSAPPVHSAAPTFSHVRAIALPFSEVSHMLVRTVEEKNKKAAGVGGEGALK